MTLLSRLLAIGMTGMSIPSAHADLGMPAVFSDGAVLQGGEGIPVWGWGEPAMKVSVTFSGQSKSTLIDSEGRWTVVLDPVAASYDEKTMIVKAGSESREIRRVLVGEVWLCMGQSNMESTLSSMARRTKDPGYEAVTAFNAREIRNADDPYLRHLLVEKRAVFASGERDFNGSWQSATTDKVGDFSATAYYFAKELREKLDRPVGVINVSWGAQRIDPFIPPSAWLANESYRAGYEQTMPDMKARIAAYDPAAEEKKYQEAMVGWEAAGGRGRPPRKPDVPTADSPSRPGTIFNGMIHPLVPYAISGVIWYQGESHNQNHAHQYGAMLEMLVSGIRKEWGLAALPFYFCQLANHWTSKEEPINEKNNWLTISNQIRLASTSIPNTGMAVLNDVGQEKDIHPRNKYDVGLRLSKWALHKTYGLTDIVPAGPLYHSHEKKGSVMVVTFDHSGSGLVIAEKSLTKPAKVIDAPLEGFEICDEDSGWRWADARIIGPDKVEISHPGVKSPTGVRFAWQPNPTKANLYNKEGLPAGLFSTLPPIHK
ncbi:sialate O-acetylesterase [Haloferula sp.]|uniref:sialate O-acetylesterase n=1 Tax=Haloferula sp. TaxID=2497595 RepID=UPI003C75E38D